jgi:hypothetical protein
LVIAVLLRSLVAYGATPGGDRGRGKKAQQGTQTT